MRATELSETDLRDEASGTSTQECLPEPVQPEYISEQLDELIKLREATDQEIQRRNTPSGLLDRIAPFRTSTS